MRKFFKESGKSSGVFYFGRTVLGKSTDMQLIYDQVFRREKRRRVIFPVEVVFYDTGFIMLSPRRSVAPVALSRDCPGIGIQKIFITVEDQSLLWFIRAVHAVCIFKFFYVEFEYDHGIYVSDSIMLRERKNRERFMLGSMEQKKFNVSCAV